MATDLWLIVQVTLALHTLAMPVGSLKKVVEQRVGVRAHEQRLLFAGRQLDEQDEARTSLRDYGIAEKSTIFLCVR